MKCEDFEKNIYLYSELSERKRVEVDAHVQQCHACKELFQSVSAAQELIKHLSGTKPEPINHSRLTSSIMQAVQKKESNFNLSFLNSLFLKYSMVAISTLLIVTFTIEQNSATGILPAQQPLQSGTVTLNSVSIAKNFQERKEKNQLHITSLYACAKSEGCTKTLIENFRKKTL